MIKHKLTGLMAIAAGIIFFASCATTHPNEQLIVGKWNTQKVEKYVDPTAAPAESKTEVVAPKTVKVKTDTTSKAGSKGGGNVSTVNPRAEDALQRMIRVEERSSLEVYANKMAVKNYPKKTVKATWKLKGKGTRFVAKDLATKEKHYFDLLEVSETRIVLIEHTPAGDLKITYAKQQ